ncbi:MAG TPA: SdrD B-like domain-containing protein [Thermoanaerobaculia bacterium]
MILLLSLAAAVASPAQELPRIEQDFVQWTQVVIDGNHPAGSNTYRNLEGLEQSLFESAVQAFLAEDWALADERAGVVGYDVVTFRDTGNDGEVYYGLIPEAGNGDGRGFYFVRPRAQVQRRLVLQAPHAVEDNRTGVFGSEIFRASGARALMLTGADRCASSRPSDCTGSTDCGAHRVSDGAHAVNTFFQSFHRLASREHADTVVLQLHGFKVSINSTTGLPNDPEFSISDGTTTNRAETTLANRFYSNLQARISPRAGNSCNWTGQDNFKCGTESVQARDTNNSTNACTTNASTASGRFLHLEMSNDLREPGGSYETSLVIDTVNAIIPRTAEVGDFIWADANGNGVQDAGERGVHGVTVEVLDANSNVVGSGATRVGSYRIGNLVAGTYRLRVQLPAGYTYGTGVDTSTGVSNAFPLAAGESRANVDVALIPSAVGQVGDRVWLDEDEDGLLDRSVENEIFSVQLLAGDDVVESTVTDEDGFYAIDNVPPGDYRLKVDPGAYGLTVQGAGLTDDDSEVSPQTGKSAEFNLAGVSDVTRDAGLLEPCYDVDLVAPGSVWNWWTPGATDAVPAGWNQPVFAGESAWNNGFSPLGFGTSRAVTNTGVPPTGMYATYFRLAFAAADPQVFQGDLRLTLTRNDGVVVYLNGIEILRRNLPWGAALSVNAQASTKSDTIETIAIPAALLQASNLLAVELHQAAGSTSVGLFDLTLTGKVCGGCRVKEAVVTTTKATFIESGSGPMGAEELVELDGGSGAKSALIEWDLSSLPQGADVLHAELEVFIDADSGADTSHRYAIQELLRPWNEGEATWSRATATVDWLALGATGTNDSGAARLGLMPRNTANDVSASVSLNPAGRSVIEKWIDNGNLNFGFLIDAEAGATDGLDILSDDHTSTTPGAHAPRLRVIYVDPTCQP